jgi:hypothetical protein
MASEGTPSAAGLPVSNSAPGPDPCPEAANQMNSCWSCLVLLERNAVVCPICGADQTLPEVKVVLEPEDPRFSPALVRRWAVAGVAILFFVAGLSWYALRAPDSDSPEQAEALATKTLFQLRSDLLDYALRSGGKYPATMETLAGRTASLVEDARNAGYEVIYTPQPSPNDGLIRAFSLTARAQTEHLRNFYVDESGQMRATGENRSATIQDPPI